MRFGLSDGPGAIGRPGHHLAGLLGLIELFYASSICIQTQTYPYDLSGTRAYTFYVSIVHTRPLRMARQREREIETPSSRLSNISVVAFAPGFCEHDGIAASAAPNVLIRLLPQTFVQTGLQPQTAQQKPCVCLVQTAPVCVPASLVAWLAAALLGHFVPRGMPYLYSLCLVQTAHRGS